MGFPFFLPDKDRLVFYQKKIHAPYLLINKLLPSEQWSSARDYVVSQGIFSNVWTHFWLSQLGNPIGT